MHKNVKLLFDAFKKADPIVVFHHVSPDPDAYGTQMGMVEFLKYRFPDKTILAAGSQSDMDEISDEQMKNALALICDTSTADRVDDMRYKEARQIARIDHHLKVVDFGDLDYVDESAAAASQVAVSLLKANNEMIPPKAASHFLYGLIGDTNRFTLPNVTPETFEAAAWLLEMGGEIPPVIQAIYSKSQEVFRYRSLVRQKAQFLDHFAFSLMNREDYLSLGVNFEDAKSSVDELSNIQGIEIWALITQNIDGTYYQASLRSKQIPVVELANRYHGGGHQLACGIKNLTAQDVQSLLVELRDLASDFKK